MTAPEPSNLERQVRDALDRLPDSADAIADYFTEIGIKGSMEVDRCPVAVYLSGEVEGLGRDVAVCSERVMAGRFLETEVRDLPNAVADFIRAFDTGTYPHLYERLS